ncbi:VOC family protein [Streptacidiphilus sp. N1-12]|uniref:VOC family protein n=2 Tax=Streptacidiphilus alkalitolerans TaxID=3342712 RepID=A0ABV6VLW3_9ACTN
MMGFGSVPPQDPHKALHSAEGALRGEPTGRADNPVVKVWDVAWLVFEKPDLDRAERFARDFGFTVTSRTPDELRLRGTFPGTDAVVIRRGPRAGFVGPVFQAQERPDLDRLAARTGARVKPLPGHRDGAVVELLDPSGLAVAVVHGADVHPVLPDQKPLVLNTGTSWPRVNTTQRPAREPSRIQRLGHFVFETPHFTTALNWYQETLGLLVSDFQFLPRERALGPTMAFMRCDRGGQAADHHTMALHLSPRTGYVHSAYQVADLDALAAGGAYLAERGYHRAWGIGRHILGSQIFDYWRDPDRLMVEHFTDGDRFDASVQPGWAPMTASGLAQWGPPVTRDFLGTNPSPALLREVYSALREPDSEVTAKRLLSLVRAMSS